MKNESLEAKMRGIEEDVPVVEQVEEKQLHMQLMDVIVSLDERSRSIVEYRLYRQLSFKEIAHLTGIRESTAKVIYFRAKVKIQDQMKERYGYEV